MDKKFIIIAVVIVLVVLVFAFVYFQPQTARGIKVVLPNGGETWAKGQNVEILWNAGKETKNVNIRLEILGNSDAQNFNAAIASNVPNTGSYKWTVQDLYAEVWGVKTLPASDQYVVVIEDSGNNSVYDDSDSVFNIK